MKQITHLPIFTINAWENGWWTDKWHCIFRVRNGNYCCVRFLVCHECSLLINDLRVRARLHYQTSLIQARHYPLAAFWKTNQDQLNGNFLNIMRFTSIIIAAFHFLRISCSSILSDMLPFGVRCIRYSSVGCMFDIRSVL